MNKVAVYGISGKKIFRVSAQDSEFAKTDTSMLNSGVYFVVIEGLGVSKFVVK